VIPNSQKNGVNPALFKSLYQEKKKNPTNANQQSREKGMDSHKRS
jgi:hypothetical protein